jgi:hypothetical protein
MNWAILVVAGFFEVGWAIGLEYTVGFTRLWPSVWTVLAMVISLGLLGIAMKTLPVGTAVQRLGWGRRCRYRRTRDCAAWRVGEPASDNQCCPHSCGHRGTQVLKLDRFADTAPEEFGGNGQGIVKFFGCFE